MPHVGGTYITTTVFRLGGVDTEAAERFEAEEPEAFAALDRQIKRILGRTVMSLSGVRVKLDVTKPEGKRLVSARLEDGTPIRDKDFYSVTTNDFLLMGGDGYTEFAEGIDVEDTGILMRDAFAEHIARLGTIAPRLDGRIQVSR